VEEELEGSQLLRVARQAWVASGESEAQAKQLARSLMDVVESRYLAPCLALPVFQSLFTRMAASRAAARTASGALSEARQLGRQGSSDEAAREAAALGRVSEAASLGALPSEREGQQGAPSKGSGPGPAACAAAAICLRELASCVLAPRCCLEARLRLAVLVCRDPADEGDLAAAERLLMSSLAVADAADSDVGTLDLEDELGAGSGQDQGPVQLRRLPALRKAVLKKLCMLLCQQVGGQGAPVFSSHLHSEAPRLTPSSLSPPGPRC
jgi:hypothetical protein